MKSGTVKSRFPKGRADVDFGDAVILGEAVQFELLVTVAIVLAPIPGIPISMLICALQLCQFQISTLVS